jgi:hypothetical protein
MAKTDTATPGKTRFLKEFLHDNPQGNTKAVNEAWQAAGFDGTISTALVYKTRASLGLTGNLRGKTKKPKTAAKGKATSTGKKLNRSTQQGKQGIARPAPPRKLGGRTALGRRRPEGAKTNQPRATPWEGKGSFHPPQALKGRYTLVMSPFRPFRAFRARRRVVPRFPGRCLFRPLRGK